MQRLLQLKLLPTHTHAAPQGLQRAVVRALELRHTEVLRHLGSNHRNAESTAEFASVLAALPSRQRDDVLSLLEPCQRESVLRHLPRYARKQWLCSGASAGSSANASTSSSARLKKARPSTWLRNLYRALRQG